MQGQSVPRLILHRYASIRGHIKTGDLILYSSNGFWGRLIKWRSQSWPTHAGVAVRMAGRLMMFESKEGLGKGSGPRLVPLSGQGNFYLVNGFRQTANPTEIEQRGFECLGQFRYGWLDCLMAGIDGTTLRDNGRMQCAEYAAHILGWQDSVSQTPGGLLKKAERHGGRVSSISL